MVGDRAGKPSGAVGFLPKKRLKIHKICEEKEKFFLERFLTFSTGLLKGDAREKKNANAQHNTNKRTMKSIGKRKITNHELKPTGVKRAPFTHGIRGSVQHA